MSELPGAAERPAQHNTLRGGSRPAIAILLITALTVLTHVWCLWDGSVLDDHWHQRGLREHGWTLAELLRTLTIDTRDFIDMWWQDRPIRWEYARPAFILAMKFVYHVLGNDNPAALHAYSIGLHWIGALLTWRLCWWLTRRPVWSLLGGLVFAAYPHSVVSVAWPSAQNCVQQTMLLLAALLCYIRASRLRSPAGLFGFENTVGWAVPTSSTSVMSGEFPTFDGEQEVGTAHPTTARAGWRAAVNGRSGGGFLLLATFVFWLLALFTRENAILSPVILAACDVSFGGDGGKWGGVRHLWRRRGVYLAMALIAVAFAAWRIATVKQGMPDVYMRRPDGDYLGYVTWCIAKLLHYIATSLWFAPMTIGPTGRFDPWREAPGDCLLMIAIIAVLWGGYAAACRRVPGWWIWPLWIILAVLPVVPVIATPHTGYMCGVGVAVGLAVGGAFGYRRRTEQALPVPARPEVASARRGAARAPHATHFPARLNRAWAWLYFAGACFFCLLNRWQWTGTIAAERYLQAWVIADPPTHAVRDAFFINLPFVNVYTKPALDRRLGADFSAVRCHALTWAPQPALVEELTVVEQLDDFSFTVEMISGQSYFSRLVGRFVLEGGRAAGNFVVGETVHGDDFDATIVEMDREGVRKLIFRFPRPLVDPAYCFYVSTPDCGAGKVRFRCLADSTTPGEAGDPRTAASASAARDDSLATPVLDVSAAAAQLDAGRAAAADGLFAALDSPNPAIRSIAQTKLREVAVCVARAQAAWIQLVLDQPRMSAEDWRAVRAWWNNTVDDALLSVIWRRRFDFDSYIKEREELPHARVWAARVFRTDLYLTGPPWPGPRRFAQQP